MPVKKYIYPDSMSSDARRAYQMHAWNAKRRGIPFLFTPDEWWAWWQVDGRWLKRGRGRLQLVMARFGDTGPYHKDNVYCATQQRNQADVSSLSRSEGIKSAYANGHRTHLEGKFGDDHPKSRAVIDPDGKRWPSATEAGMEWGYTRQHCAKLARLGLNGWRYEGQPFIRQRARPRR